MSSINLVGIALDWAHQLIVFFTEFLPILQWMIVAIAVLLVILVIGRSLRRSNLYLGQNRQLGKGVRFASWIATMPDSVFKKERKVRIQWQGWGLAIGVSVTALGIKQSIEMLGTILIPVGIIFVILASALFITEFFYYCIIRRFIATQLAIAIVRQSVGSRILKTSLVVACQTNAVGFWLQCNCPSLNHPWLCKKISELDIECFDPNPIRS